jgi:hypothetical protein
VAATGPRFGELEGPAGDIARFRELTAYLVRVGEDVERIGRLRAPAQRFE